MKRKLWYDPPKNPTAILWQKSGEPYTNYYRKSHKGLINKTVKYKQSQEIQVVV